MSKVTCFILQADTEEVLEKLRRGSGKNEGEWTGKVEISVKSPWQLVKHA